MDEEKYISSDALLKRLKNQAEVLTKTPEEFALLDIFEELSAISYAKNVKSQRGLK